MTDQAATFDPMDPHGFHAHDAHEGHHVVSFRMLLTVLIALLVFTFLTVAASRVEVWIGEATGATIPQWVNVVVAMSIATVKGALVLMFFMQLYYDKPLNTIIFLFCLFAFALFLGLTALDLNTRGRVYDWKQGEIIAGGNSVGLNRSAEGVSMTAFTPIQEWAKQVKVEKLGSEEAFKEYKAEKKDYEPESSSAAASRPRSGLTPGLFEAQTPQAEGLGGDEEADGGEEPGDGDETQS